MRYLKIACMGVWLFAPVASTYGQLGNGIGGSGIGGSGIGGSMSGGARGLSMPQGSLRNSPIANPAPSLTPHEVFHPRGSLRPGQVRNPRGSLFRPRTAGSQNPLRQSTWDPVGSPRGLASKRAAVALEQTLAKVAAGKGWETYLALGKLQQINDASDGLIHEQQRQQLTSIAERFDSVAKDQAFHSIHQLPEFQATRRALWGYLQWRDQQLYAELRKSFAQLDRELKTHTNGQSWAAYLALPPALQTARSAGGYEAASKLLTRFQKVDTDPAFALIVSLQWFSPAYESLTRFVAAMDEGRSRTPSDQKADAPAGLDDVNDRFPNSEGAQPQTAERKPAR